MARHFFVFEKFSGSSETCYIFGSNTLSMRKVKLTCDYIGYALVIMTRIDLLDFAA